MRKVAEPDPVQKQLRQHKSLWNKEVSAFINDLIHYKKMMNGWPSKFFPQRSKITFPIPADPSKIIGDLASKFEKITEDAKAIVQEQVNYSKNRRLPRRQQAINTLDLLDKKYGPTEQQVRSPLEQKLSGICSSELVKLADEIADKYDLLAQGSNSLTRFFARLLNPGIGFSQAARIRKLRMQLLSSCAKIFKELEKFQVEIVKSSDKSIDDSFKLLGNIWEDWQTVLTVFNTYKSMIPSSEKHTSEDASDSKGIKEDRSKNKQEKESEKFQKEFEKVNTSVDQGGPEPGDIDYELPAMQGEQVPDIKINLSPPVASRGPESWEAGAQRQKKIDKEQEKLNKIKDKERQKAMKNNPLALALPNATVQLEVVAQAFIQKWIGKKRHELSMFDETSSQRLQAFDVADQMRKVIDEIMNHLEKDINVGVMQPMVDKVNRQIMFIRGLVRNLKHIHGTKNKK